MDKKDLFNSAKPLKAISSEAINDYNQKKEFLISIINEQMLKRDDIHNLIGKNGIEMMKNNHSNHVKFIFAIIQDFNAEVLIDTILWVFRTYKSHGFAINYWKVQLNLWIKILEQNLNNATFNEIRPFYEWMLNNIPIFDKLANQETE